MTEPAWLNELAERGVLRRVEMVRARMQHWGLGAGDPGHIDVDDPTNLDREHPLYVREDHPGLAGYYARIDAEARRPDLPADDIDELRRRAGLTREPDPTPQVTAVSNAWRSDVTAAAEVHAQADATARAGDVRVAEPFREEEIELLERVDSAEAQAARREVGGRMDWTHRRPERAVQPAPGRQLGRSVDGSD